MHEEKGLVWMSQYVGISSRLHGDALPLEALWWLQVGSVLTGCCPMMDTWKRRLALFL